MNPGRVFPGEDGGGEAPLGGAVIVFAVLWVAVPTPEDTRRGLGGILGRAST